tara:strand:+ start:1195 stop:1377 length:183 start_codon:yes stop_codon:yes gene_type:complete
VFTNRAEPVSPNLLNKMRTDGACSAADLRWSVLYALTREDADRLQWAYKWGAMRNKGAVL